MSKKEKRKRWLYICVIAGIIVSVVLSLCKIYESQENIFFTEYENEYEKDDTIIYRYNSKSNSVVEIGRVQGKLHDCVINSDETYITGLIYEEVSFDGVKIVRYDLATGTVETLDATEKIAALTDNHAGLINSLIYDGGNKIFVDFQDKNGGIKWLLYDLTTDQYDIIEGEEDIARSLTIHNGDLWYIADSEGWYSGPLYRYDLESKEKTKIMESAQYDSVVLPEMGLVAYTKGLYNDKIYLYDMRTQETSYIAEGGWNTYYGELNWTNSRWSDNGREFFYIESFPGLFNASTERLKIYNVITRSSRCIYKIRMTTHEFQYVLKR